MNEPIKSQKHYKFSKSIPKHPAILDRWLIFLTIGGVSTYDLQWENRRPAIDFIWISWESNTPHTDEYNTVLCDVVETPASWNEYHVIFKSSAIRYILCNSGQLTNFLNWDIGISLKNISTYIITHCLNISTKYIQVLKNGWATQTKDTTSNLWWGCM